MLTDHLGQISWTTADRNNLDRVTFKVQVNLVPSPMWTEVMALPMLLIQTGSVQLSPPLGTILVSVCSIDYSQSLLQVITN